MAAVRSQKTSSPMPPSTYQVFLSFRGEDTRHSFISHLYKALVDSGFQTFRDDDGITRGEDIKLELKKAIVESKISVVTISENYASSGWCLDELVMILKRKETSGHAVLPVFYHVDPSHVRKQKGSFAEAFAAHDERCKAEIEDERREELMEKIKQWRAALGKIADLAGMELRKQADRDEALFIQKIVKVIGDKVTRTILNVPPHLIGIDYQVYTINLWLLDGSNKVGFMAICGMGGIGKTTMAKRVFNSNSQWFDSGSFLCDINEISKNSDGVIRLQRRLISDILNGKKEKISSQDEGIIKIKAAICRRRVLIVFDDVDNSSQLEAIIGMRDWFYPGSKIIVTTRNRGLLRNEEGYTIHEVEKLDGNKSLELFSWHAFGQDYPPEAFIEHSKRVADHCGGLPLALKVLGSSLNGLALDLWKSAVDKLEVIPDNEIVKKLKLSYDYLPDDHDRNLFLDIVCFFEGEERNRVVAILDEDYVFPKFGIQTLMDRCLLDVVGCNKLMIHQYIKDMGREIIRIESRKEPGKRSRLWNHTDSFDVLKENTGTEAIEGLVLDKPVLKQQETGEFINNPLLSGQGNSLNRQLFRFRFNFFSSHVVNSSFGHSNEDGLKTKAFTKMHKLRILKINGYKLIGDFKDFPTKLRWLCWSGFPLEYMPIDFPLERLVALDMCNSYLKQLWNVPKVDGAFKLEPLANIDAEIINNLGLYDLEPLKNIEMDWYTPATGAEEKGPIQGIYESGGIFSIFFPGSQIPGWFHTKVAGSSLSFIVPSPVDLMFRSMILCYVYRMRPPYYHNLSLGKVIFNKTKGRMHIYRPYSYVLPEPHEYVIWLSQLMFKSHELEVGDELVIELLSTEFYEVKEIGIHILYKEEEQRGKQSKGQEVIQHVPALTHLDHFVLGSSVLLLRKNNHDDYRNIGNRFCQISPSFTEDERYSNKGPLRLVYEEPPACNTTKIQAHYLVSRGLTFGYGFTSGEP